MDKEKARTKTCPFNIIVMANMQIAATGDSQLQEEMKRTAFCAPDDCMMWNDEKKCGNTTYSGGCGLKTMQGI